MITSPSKEYSSLSAGKISQLQNFDSSQYRSLRNIGIAMDDRTVEMLQRGSKHMSSMFASDAIQPLVTTASLGTPVQFLQNWLPGFVFVNTAARCIDDFIGLMITGEWSDEQIVQGILERTGTSQLYGDYTNVPLSSWNTNYNYRTVVRFEEGLKVGNLEAARAARQQVNDAGMKREAAALELEIQRNAVGFYGFNSGNNNTYGFLNDPGLSAYVEVAEGASTTTEWIDKTFLEICQDIRTGVVALRTNSQGTIDPSKIPLTLAVATNCVDWLSKTSDFGISVSDWLKVAYPLIRVVSAPQLNEAYTSENVFYLYADRIDDMSTDGGKVWIQPVPIKFQVLGVQQLAKAYEEDYSNATAGAMCKRPYAVVRYFGI